ncbi:hypothetical protein [Sphingomonas sp.]|uniref:TonB-dependent receptor n=1 Tax=Sphingomonas sp. TaxID=28214 RepID=UPI001B0BF663|nr:hypothetical protein [Sphingomonas sp.]MBO9712314.1 hypothetical protein [Sphingomonas sp.]
MRGARRGRRSIDCALAAACALLCVSEAPAQEIGAQEAGQHADSPDPSQPHPSEIVVTGTRGSAVTDIAPLAELDSSAVEAIGAATMPDLLRAIRGTTQSADGSDPIFLLNSQRVSGYQDIGSLPPEAIEKIEVLPEQAALRFGFPPTRRVVNFITKRRFRQVEVRTSAGTTTNWGSGTEKANLALTRLSDDRRLTLGLEVRRTDALYQSDRTIAPDPDVPFDIIGNVTGASGGEIDPALSAAAGQLVTIAPVPQAAADRTTLTGFAAGANEPRLSDLGRYRTLAPANDAVKAEAVIADRIGGTLAGSLSLSAERSQDRTIGGPASIRLLVPETNPHSPFTVPVIVNRYLIEAPSLRERETTTTLHAGFTLRGAIAGWRWDFTGAFDQKQVDGRGERGIDPTAANAAIAAGADPFVPLAPSLVAARLTDVTRLRTRTAGAKVVATNNPLRLPAGRVTITATAEAERAAAFSSSRGPNPSELSLGRARFEGAVSIDVPLTSRREQVLPFLGDLSVNASFNARDVGGFGMLDDTTYGVAWAPVTGIQLLATVRRSAAAPDMAQQSTPATRVENVPVFDDANGRTELVTLFADGNPDLRAEHRLVRSLALTIKPFAKRELRVSATYEATTIRDQTGTVRAITSQTSALLPDLFVRDPDGRLVSVAYRPINFALERQRTLSLTATASGKLGKASPRPAPGAKAPPPAQANYYAGIGPSIRFSDRLQLRPGTPELDLLGGDTIAGWNQSRISGYAYGGINYLGHGLTFSAWYQTPNRIRSPNPASDLRFSSVLKLNLGGYLNLHRVLKGDWSKKMQLRLDIADLTDSHQRIRDGTGKIPARFQPDYLNPLGRTVTVTLRKSF